VSPEGSTDEEEQKDVHLTEAVLNAHCADERDGRGDWQQMGYSGAEASHTQAGIDGHDQDDKRTNIPDDERWIEWEERERHKEQGEDRSVGVVDAAYASALICARVCSANP
jgi:hypothetical protein